MDGQYRPATTRRRPAPPPPLVHDYDDLGDDQEIGVFTADRYFSGAVDAAEDSISNGAQLWCDRSSSSLSLSSAAFKAGAVMDWSAPTLTAGTSSSEASWNSRSVLLPPKPSVVVAAVPVDVESKPSGEEESGHAPGGRHSSSLLVRWLLGVAGCACPGGSFGGDVDAAAAVDGGKKRSTETDAVLPGRTRSEAAVEETEVTTARVRPGNWDVDVDGDAFHAGRDTLPPLQLVEPRHLRGDTGELSMRVLNPTATDERRRKSSDMFHLSAGRHGMSTLAPAPAARQQNSAFTIVAGRTAHDDVANRARAIIPRDSGAAVDDDDGDDASAELECVYAPSEASVVWSVVTADGAASGANFSSAASGYYHYYDYHNDGDVEAAAKSNRRGRGNGGNGLLMGCVSGSAVDAIGPAQPGAAAGSRQPGTRGAAHVARRR